MLFNTQRMNLTQSLLFFGIPGLLMFAGVFWLVPVLDRLGVPLIVSWTVAVWMPVLILLYLVIRHFYRNPHEPFSTRFRFRKISRKEALWALGAFIVIQTLELMLSETGFYLSKIPLFGLPPILPDLFNPSFQPEQGLTRLMGVPLKGNAWLIGYWLFWVVINIGGEEILWRGYALPLQEKVFGKWAWLVNGLCWNVLVHCFFRWNTITLLPISLILPFLVQKFRNTWIGVIIHAAGNLLVLLVIIPEIF